MGSKQMMFSMSNPELVETARETRRLLKAHPQGERSFETWANETIPDPKKRVRVIVTRDVLDNLNARRNITQIKRVTVWKPTTEFEKWGRVEVEFFDFRRRFKR